MATDATTGQPIFHGSTRVGLRNVGSYLVSGHPYITGSGAYPTGMHLMAEASSLAASSSAIAFKTGGDGTAGYPAEVRVNFPYVTKRILVFASSSNPSPTAQLIRVHFDTIYPEGTDASIAGNRVHDGDYFMDLDLDEDYWEFNVKTDRIYLSTINQTTGFKLYAELTNIPTGSMYSLTGSGISD